MKVVDSKLLAIKKWIYFAHIAYKTVRAVR